MGIFDSILGFLNPEVISTYNDLVNNHSEAFRRWRGKQIVGTLSNCFDLRPSYNDKLYVVNHKKEILDFEKIIAEEKAYAKRRQDVIQAASLYPHAFYALVKKLSLKEIPGISVTLPGNRKSKYAIRLEKESKRKNVELSSKNKSGSSEAIIRDIPNIESSIESLINSLKDFHIENFWDYSDSSRIKGTHFSQVQKNRIEPRSINNLDKEEYEKIYLHINELRSDEDRIKAELRKEDIQILNSATL